MRREPPQALRCAYLFVIILTVRLSRPTHTRATALVPGIGGLLVLRQLAGARQGWR